MTMPLQGQFVVRWLVIATINMHAKFEVSSLSRGPGTVLRRL